MLLFLQQPLALLAACLPFLSNMKLPSLSTTALLASSHVLASKVFDLSEANWTLTSPGNDSVKAVKGQVPSQVHLDLFAADVIPDPYFGLNDFELRWVARSNWSYTAEVDGL